MPNSDAQTPPRVPEAVTMVPVSAIRSNPATFQWRSGINADGEVKSHQITHHFSGPIKPVVLYEDEEGQLSVVDGHHRLAYARRESMEALPAYVLSWKNGITAKDAMVLGAYINFDEEFGRGQQPSERVVWDAARVFHKVHNGEAKEVAPLPIPARQPGQLHDAYAAGALTNPAFAYVERGDVTVGTGGKVAGAFGTPTNQVLVLELIRGLPREMQRL